MVLFGFTIERLGFLPALALMFLVAAYAGNEFRLREVFVLTAVMELFRRDRLHLGPEAALSALRLEFLTMEILEHFALGFGVAMTVQNLTYCLLGVALGTLIGVLPGVGPLVTISMLLPITFGLPPVSALIMLSGIYYGAQYGGSTPPSSSTCRAKRRRP